MIKDIILLAVSAVCLCSGIAGRVYLRSKAVNTANPKKAKTKKLLFTALAVFGGWLLIGTLITMFSAKKSEFKLEFELFSDRINLFGVSFAKTTVISYCITVIAIVLGLIFRFIVFPKFSPDNPKGLQNVMELAVEAMENFAKNSLCDYSGRLAPYMFSLAVYMIFCAFTELFGLRAPTSDLVTTFAMGLLTFFLINIYGVKKKGIGGRLKGMAKPTLLVFPMKILSDIAVPVSLACRLFGNMLGGMIVMDLLKSVLGGYASGIPAVAGLYFNLFHPVIQTYIFIILSMTFINEAVE